MADIRAKALAYLRNGDVVVGVARAGMGDERPYEVVAKVKGHEDTYTVQLLRDGLAVWRCTCPQTHPNGDGCAHIASVQLVTGWPSLAAKPIKETT